MAVKKKVIVSEPTPAKKVIKKVVKKPVKVKPTVVEPITLVIKYPPGTAVKYAQNTRASKNNTTATFENMINDYIHQVIISKHNNILYKMVATNFYLEEGEFELR